MATDQEDEGRHMQRSSGKEEIPTKRLDFCRHSQKLQLSKGKKGAINNSRTRAVKATAHADYTEANRAVKNSKKKTDKESFIEDLAKKAEAA